MFAGALLKIYSTVRLVFIWGIKKKTATTKKRGEIVYIFL